MIRLISSSPTDAPILSILRKTESPTQILKGSIDKQREKIDSLYEEKAMYILTKNDENALNREISTHEQALEGLKTELHSLKRPSLKFGKVCYVFLIPCNNEYKQANLLDELFYNKSDEARARSEVAEQTDSLCEAFQRVLKKELPRQSANILLTALQR